MSGLAPYAQGYFWLFSSFALHMTYLTLFYRRSGFNDAQIGQLEAIGSVCIIASALFWGPLADRLGKQQRLLAAISVVLALAFPLLWVMPATLWALAPVVVLIYLCRSPLVPLMDSLFLGDLHRRGDAQLRHYGRVRVWGSIGFIVAANTVPLLLADDRTSDPLRRLAPVFVAFSLFSLALAARAWFLPAVPARSRPPVEGDLLNHLKAVFRLRRYKRLLVILLVSWIANQSYYLYLSLYLDQIGVPDEQKGLYWSMGVLAEMALLTSAPWLLRRISLRGLMLWGLAGRVVRLAGLAFAMPPALVLWCFQPLHALGFAAVHVATMGYLGKLVPADLRATGQTVNAGLVAGVGGLLGNLMGGWVSEHYASGPGLFGFHGLHAAYLVCAVLQLLVLAAAWRWLDEPQPVEAAESPVAAEQASE